MELNSPINGRITGRDEVSHFEAVLRVYDVTAEVEILLRFLVRTECVLIGHLIKQRSVLEKQSSSVIKSVQQIDLCLITEMDFICDVFEVL